MTDLLKKLEEDHEKVFIDKYDDWKVLLDNINNDIRKNINTLGIPSNMYEDKLFTYDEFCRVYMEKIKEVFKIKNDYTEKEIDKVVYDMVVDKMNKIKDVNVNVIYREFLIDFNKNYTLGRYV